MIMKRRFLVMGLCLGILLGLIFNARGGGHAYGHRTASGMLIVFAYTDAQVSIDLSDGHPNDRYNIECSTNCTSWSLVTAARLSPQGAFHYAYTNLAPYCYYRVMN